MELTPEQKLANLRESFLSWDTQDVSINEFVRIYKEVGKALLSEVDKPYLEAVYVTE